MKKLQKSALLILICSSASFAEEPIPFHSEIFFLTPSDTKECSIAVQFYSNGVVIGGNRAIIKAGETRKMSGVHYVCGEQDDDSYLTHDQG